MIKLIATDIDATLLPAGTKTPDNEASEVIRRLVAKGVKVAFSSGRALSALESLFPEVADKIIYICANGTRIAQHGRTTFLQPLASPERLARLINAVRQLHCEFMLDTDGVTLLEDGVSDEFCRMIDAAGIEYLRVKDVLKTSLTITKISIAFPGGPQELRHSGLVEDFSDEYTLIATGGVFVDVIAKNADKGKAVRKIQEQFGILPSETMVFGDAENDVSMFAASPNSYASELSPENVKAHARCTFEPPERNGVIKLLAELL